MTGSYKQVYDLCNIDDLQERQRWQRGAARGILSAIRDVDGFKYSVNNIWTSKDDKGFRFSWNCLDSRENKDRHANSLNNGTESLDSPTGPVRIRKETFDCRGHVAVKFSGKRYVVEVVYKHTAMHPSVADRAPPPRTRPRGRPRKDQSTTAVYGGVASPLNGSTASTPSSSMASQLQAFSAYESPAFSSPLQQQSPMTAQSATSRPKRPRGRPPKVVPQQPSFSIAAKPLSLVDLLRQSMSSDQTEPAPPEPPTHLYPPSAPVQHVPPSIGYAHPINAHPTPPPPPAAFYIPDIYHPQSVMRTPPVPKKQKLNSTASLARNVPLRDPSPDPWFPRR